MIRHRNRNTKNIQKFCDSYSQKSCKVDYIPLVTGGNNPTLTKNRFHSRILNDPHSYSTTVVYNKDNIVHSFQYLTNSITSVTFSFIAKPFVMNCIVRAIPEDNLLPIITLYLGQVTRNNSDTISVSFNSLDPESNYKFVVSGTDIFNVTSTIIGQTLFKGPLGFTGEMGIIGPTGIGKWGDIGPTGPMGPKGPKGPKGPTGQIGPTGQMGPTGQKGLEGSLQLWNRDASSNLSTLSRIILNTNHIPLNLDVLTIGENDNKMNIQGSLMADRMVVNKSTTQTLSIGGVNDRRNPFDISGNVFISGKMAIQNDTVADFNMDISGSVNIQRELIISKLYNSYQTPQMIDESNIQLDYSAGNDYYLKFGFNIQIYNNYTCNIQNLPRVLFTPFVITIIHDFTGLNVYDHKYYCNNVVLDGQSYSPQFNMGISDINKLATLFVQKITIIYFGSTNVKIFCDIFNYT